MPSIYEQALAFRQNLIARDSAAIEFLTTQYKIVYSNVFRSLTALNAQIEQAQASGQVVSRRWLQEQLRYQLLLRSLDAEFRQYGQQVAYLVRARQSFESQQGAADASALVQGAFNRPSIPAIQNIVSNLRDGSPLAALLDSFGEAASEHVKAVLRDAIVSGKNPRAIAGSVRDALGVPLHRALLITRTESVRAYRQASLQTYQDAGITKWRWTASKSRRTCLNCLARDGEIYEVEKPFPAHPSCRCTLTPVLESSPVRAETAGQWFAKQPDSVKREMMSGIAFDLYKQGRISLADFKGEKRNRKWGPMTYERSVKEILGE